MAQKLSPGQLTTRRQLQDHSPNYSPILHGLNEHELELRVNIVHTLINFYTTQL